MAGENAASLESEPALEEPDIEAWKEKLRAAYAAKNADKIAAIASDLAFRGTVIAAFEAGLTVVPIQDATGLTTSRIYQIKAGRRT